METDKQRITMPIYGLACGGGGALMAERAIARLAGVIRAYVNPATEMAYVEYDPGQCDPERIGETVEKVGLHAGSASVR